MLRHFRYGTIARLSKALILGIVCLAAPARAETVHILALGDSLTAGYGLMDEDGFVPQMRAWLAERGHDVRLVNGGVSGDTTAGGLARAEWSLAPEIGGMIVALGGNDMLRGIDPAVVRANIEAILDIADQHHVAVLLVGALAPGNYGPEYKTAFDALYPELAQSHGALFYESFFKALIGDEGGSLAELSALLQSDGLHPTAEGVRRIVADMGPSVEALIDRAAR